MICFALCLVSFITRGLQNNDHSTFACFLAQKILKRKLTWKIVLDYLKFFKKSVHRLNFLRKCLKSDLIPDFLKFRVPENGFFSDHAVHNFELILLRTETSRANENSKSYEEMLMRCTGAKKIDEHWWASIPLREASS